MSDNISSFDKDLNISYVDENLPRPDDRLIFKHCLSSSILYLLIYFFLCNNPFFKNYFNNPLKLLFITLLLIYTIFAPIIYLIFKPKTIHKSHSIEIFNYLKRIFCNLNVLKSDYKSVINNFIPTYYEKQSIMLIFIKVFFGTLMVRFLYNDILTINSNIIYIQKVFADAFGTFNLDIFIKDVIINCNFLYQFAITILFTIDVLMFAIGYLTENVYLRNKIRTVDTNILGILFCLICYPPFNTVTTKFLGWNQADSAIAFNDLSSLFGWSLRLIALFFLLIYALASCALGTKASNLTNRGTVSSFPYNIVRHPAYISKNLFWLFSTIPFLIVDFNAPDFEIHQYLLYAGLIILCFISWATIYYFRAIFEERHLMQDPEYQEYTKKVKYRFIPFVI